MYYCRFRMLTLFSYNYSWHQQILHQMISNMNLLIWLYEWYLWASENNIKKNQIWDECNELIKYFDWYVTAYIMQQLIWLRLFWHFWHTAEIDLINNTVFKKIQKMLKDILDVMHKAVNNMILMHHWHVIHLIFTCLLTQ